MVTSKSTPAKSAAIFPKVRRIAFRFGDPEPLKKHYIEGNIVLSHLVSLLSAGFPPGEESFIRSVRNYADQITDPVLKKRVAGFIGQEAMHGREHRALNDKIEGLGYPMVRLVNSIQEGSTQEKWFIRAEKLLPKKVHLAVTAATEHYTAVLGERVLTSEELQAIPAPEETWHLLKWHAMEELEHKAVAFDAYRAVGGSESVRITVMAFMWVATIPFVALGVFLSILTDPSAWRPIKVIRQTIELLRGPLFKGLMSDLALYMRPGFHPDDIDTSALLDKWQKELFGDEGALNDHPTSRKLAVAAEK